MFDFHPKNKIGMYSLNFLEWLQSALLKMCLVEYQGLEQKKKNKSTNSPLLLKKYCEVKGSYLAILVNDIKKAK